MQVPPTAAAAAAGVAADPTAAADPILAQQPLPMALPPPQPPQLDPLLFTSDPSDLATLPLLARLPPPPQLPTPPIPNDTPQDVAPIAHYFAAFSAKPYLSALVRKANRQLPDGRPAPAADWSLWYIEAVGPSLLFWPCPVLPKPHADIASVGAQWIAHIKTLAMPNFLNITDADVRVANVAQDPLTHQPQHLVQLNTAGCNLILLQTASALDQASLVAAIRLACFEFSKLHECYTAVLLRRPALASLPVPAHPEFHGYVQVRYPGSTEWTRLWCVVTPEPGMTSSSSSNSVTNLLKRKSLALTSSSPTPAEAGLVQFYSSKKSNAKKPVLSLGNLFQAYAVYPERPHLIDLSMLCKLEGTLVVKDPHPQSPVASPGFVLVMTESPAAMAQLLVAVVARFHLYNVHHAKRAGTVADAARLQITPPAQHKVDQGVLYLDPTNLLPQMPCDADHVATKAWLEKALAADTAAAAATALPAPVTVLPEGAGVTPRQRPPPAGRIVGASMRPDSATIRPGSMVVVGRAPQLPSDTGSSDDSDDSDDEESSNDDDDDESGSDQESDGGNASGSDRVLAQRSSVLGAPGKRPQSPAANGLEKDLARMSVVAKPVAAATQRSSGSESDSESESESSSESESDDDEATPPSSQAKAPASPIAPKSVSPTTAPAVTAAPAPLPVAKDGAHETDSGTVSDTEDSDASTTSGSGTSSSSGSEETTSSSGSDDDDDSGSVSDDNDTVQQRMPGARASALPPQFDPSFVPPQPMGAGVDPYAVDFMAGLGGTGSDNSSQSNMPLGASAASASGTPSTPSSFAPNSLLSNPNAAATNRVDTGEPLVPAFVQFGGLLSRPKPSLLAQHQEVQKRQQYYAQLQTFQQQQQMEAAVRQQEQYAVLSRPRGPLLQMAAPRDRDREASGLLSVVSQREQSRAQQKQMYGGGGYSSSGVAELVERGAGTGKAVAMDFERDRERLLALEQRQMAKELAEERQRMEEMMQVKREQQRLALQQQQQQQIMWQQQQQQQQQQQRAAAAAAAMQQPPYGQAQPAAGLYGAPAGARASYYGAPTSGPPMMGMQSPGMPAPQPAAGGLSTDSSEEEDDDDASETGTSETGSDETGSGSGTSESESESDDDDKPAAATTKAKGPATPIVAPKSSPRAAPVASDSASDSDSEPSTPRRRTAGKRQPTAAKSAKKPSTPTTAKASKKQQRALAAAAAAPAMQPPMASPFYGAPMPGGAPAPPGMYGAAGAPAGAPGAVPPGVHPAHAAAYAMQMQHMQQQMYAGMGLMSPMMAAMMMQQQQQMAAMHQQMAAMPPPPPVKKSRKKAAAKKKTARKARREPSSSEDEEDNSESEQEQVSSEQEPDEEQDSSEEEERRARKARKSAKGKSKAGKRK